MQVKKYKLVAVPVDEIEAVINKLMEEGWQPFGAPFVIPAKPGDLSLQENMVYQAMIHPG